MIFGYTMIFVNDVEATLAFYEKAFDCKTRFMAESKLYGELDTGTTKLAFVSEKMADGLNINNHNASQQSPGFIIGFINDDVQKAYDHALKMGCTSLKTPEQTPWGQLVAHVKDLNGIIVEICTPLTY